MEISKLIQSLRLEKNMTMIDLAKHLGCTQSSISQWESGSSEPGAKYMKKLKDLFGEKFNIDNIDINDSQVNDIQEVYHTREKNVNDVIKSLTETNELMAESNKILSESNKILSESINKAIEVHNKVMEQLLKIEHVN